MCLVLQNISHTHNNLSKTWAVCASGLTARICRCRIVVDCTRLVSGSPSDLVRSNRTIGSIDAATDGSLLRNQTGMI